jgi:membrane protease YdiL (CAAX protease family)
VSSKQPKGYLQQSSDLTNSLILIAPLLVLYEVGLFLTQFQGLNGVDFVTVLVLHFLGPQALLVSNAVILVAILVAWKARGGEKALDLACAPLLFMECAVYAFSLGIVINAILGHLPLGGARSLGPLAALVASLGAGVNEELFFRLFLLQGLAWAIGGPEKQRRGVHVAAAALVSSLLFSAAHYLPGGDTFQVPSFLYRFIAGLLFAILFLTRGLAAAVYTHALYDVYVLLPR